MPMMYSQSWKGSTMAKLVMSPEAKADLKEIAGYIAHKLNNPDSALRLLRRVKEDTSKLRKFPEMGTPLRKSGDVEYRYIICGSYMVFHHYQEGTVYIDRILYGRRDYMAILFGALLEDADPEAQ